MSTAELQSVVARCLVDPQFLRSLRLDPQRTLARVPVDENTRRLAEGVDLQGLEHFRGLVVKVKHTPLWSTFPATLTLLQQAKLDLRVFAAYAEAFLARAREGPLLLTERASRFLDHLLTFLAAGQEPAAGVISDVARHEWKVEQSATANRSAFTPTVAAHAVTPGCTPGVLGRLEMAHYHFDVVDLAAADLSRVDPAEVPQRPVTVGYWISPGTGALRLLHLDPVSKVALSSLDGKRTNAAVDRLLTGLGLAEAGRQLDSLLTTADRLGLVTRCLRPDHGRPA
ncbi:MAG: hypothetical protein M3144_11065 [Actinomycetota bacterium]|nr:hypothetical protein [Actinomycetota bacterium]